MTLISRSCILMLSTLLLSGCTDENSIEERVNAFCQDVKVGESFDDVKARYSSTGLQSGGFAPELNESAPVQERQRISGILVESSDSRGETRPVCAIYYSSTFLGGDGKVYSTEYKSAWAHRY